ncbi:DUF1501 domain-containing protein [Novosphingobium sp. KACC 22771]|uniref:DUF1501 domain-containing protein n=1 Tax=Novosphingobium sp. KACC 22771 TaxID=3025670 RepID=UPI00236596E5|nr:DUF1501 domain-containing protein [Novosphingobium sp. KACC 22771]WDF75211.1 DUF1501 domain-containing protein [Novosphingobium sp. KACC 22771]
MTLFDRRDLIRSAAFGLPLMMAGGRAFAAPGAANNRLLVVFLRGAYDAVNVIVPGGSDFYHEARPTIALPRPDPANPDAPLPLDADWALHPALRESILPLWQARQIAFVPFAGTDDMSRSHFETQDSIELGQNIGGQRNYQSGFMGRLAAVLGADKPIAFTDQLPLCFRGGPVVPNIALGNAASKPSIDTRQTELIKAMYRGQHEGGVDLEAAIGQGFAVRDTVFQSIRGEMEAAGRGAITAKGFELSARRIGRLMRDQYNLAFVDVGGWDTHVNQGGAQGNLANRIGELGRALAGFVEAIGPEDWRNTTVVVMSEFGRTFRENGDKGTDHGHGSIYWVLGGSVAGGRMAGPQVKLAPDTLNQGRDLPVLTDYRGLIGGLLARQYGLSARQLGIVFPGAVISDLQLI